MIIGKIHSGSGLGNQLHTYVMTRVLALDKGYNFGFVGIENYKGNSFLKLDWGKPVDLKYHIEYPAGKLIIDSVHNLWEENSDVYNSEVNNVKDGTVIDGYFQSEKYFEHHREDIEQWLKTDVMEMPDDLCVINFRGGEYVGASDLYLTHDYWSLAVSEMKAKGLKFIVCTDDPHEARKFFPDFDILHEIGRDWRMIRYAKHLILSNSSFAILPAWLNKDADIIAPKFWGRRNKGYWHMPQNEYKNWRYI